MAALTDYEHLLLRSVGEFGVKGIPGLLIDVGIWGQHSLA
jgi:hypothetical protein